MGLIDLCKKYYNTTNLYEALQITEKATDKEVKKAYHKLSLRVHPDRVPENEKLEATEKFKVLSSIHSVLSDKKKRALYDETKSVDEDDMDIDMDKDWMVYWRMLFKKITLEDIQNYEKEYIGSEEERSDLKKAYLAGKGDMDYIVDRVQFLRSEHEPRVKEILNEMISNDEIPAYKIFTHEPEKKRKRRLAKERREAKEVEEESNAAETDENGLELMIRQRQSERAQLADAFFENLAAKYGSKETRTSKRKAPTKTTAGKRKK